jgi:hypothetical protein
MTSGGAPSDQAALDALLQRLTELLATKAAAKPDEAEIVKSQATQLVAMAAKPSPSPSLLQTLGQGLRQTASFIKDVAPEAITTVEELLGLVAKLHGVGL